MGEISYLLQRDELKLILMNITVPHFDGSLQYPPKQQNWQKQHHFNLLFSVWV